MLARASNIIHVIRHDVAAWSLYTLVFVTLYYLLSMISLVLRFGNLPNYINIYDWWHNVLRIVRSTPSIRDRFEIIQAEWLLEIGYMNHDFGIGISEWSLYILPVKVLGVLALGALIATYIILLRYQPCKNSKAVLRSSGAITGIGATMVSLSSLTFSWVVCCATPTWVVGLSMLGLGVSTSLWLEPLGVWLNVVGFIVVAIACLLVADSSSTTEFMEINQ